MTLLCLSEVTLSCWLHTKRQRRVCARVCACVHVCARALFGVTACPSRSRSEADQSHLSVSFQTTLPVFVCVRVHVSDRARVSNGLFYTGFFFFIHTGSITQLSFQWQTQQSAVPGYWKNIIRNKEKKKIKVSLQPLPQMSTRTNLLQDSKSSLRIFLCIQNSTT